jgi:chitosanase
MKLLSHILFSFVLFFASTANASSVRGFGEAPVFNLSTDEWQLIALPAAPPVTANTVGDVFGDDISGSYGSRWVLYEYDAQRSIYNPLQLSSGVQQGKGYWIIQLTGKTTKLDMPPGSTSSASPVPLVSATGQSAQWNLLGNPFSEPKSLDSFLIEGTHVCARGCDLDEAHQKQLIYNKVWSYENQRYEIKSGADTIEPWKGFWMPTLSGSNGHDLSLITKTVFSRQQRLIVDQFLSIFEYGKAKLVYDKAEELDDGRGITAGKVGFTSGTGDMLMVIERYTQLKPGNSLEQFLPELNRLNTVYANNGYSLSKESANTDNLVGLEAEWKINAKFKLFREVQDKIDDDLNFNPVLHHAKTLGLKFPLSLMSLYDASIQHGESGLNRLISKANQMTGGHTPKTGADEIKWLRNFNINRKAVLESNKYWRDSIHRVIEIMDLINANNTQIKPFELRIEYKYTGHPEWSDDVYHLPVY